jgi:hypothetical protein
MTSLIETMIAVLQRIQREAADDEFLRQIVSDNRTPIHQPLVGAGTKVQVQGAPQVKTVGNGRGWTNSIPEHPQSATNDLAFNAMLDQQDALDRADRAERAAKLKGTKP